MRNFPHRNIQGLCVLTSVLCLTHFLSAQEIQFTNESPVETDQGHLTLEWSQISKAVEVKVEKSTSKDFSSSKVIYQGKDNSTFISGLPQGTTYFRIHSTESNAKPSKFLEVQVAYPSTNKVILLLIIGTLVFILTLISIVHGYLQTHDQSVTDNLPDSA